MASRAPCPRQRRKAHRPTRYAPAERATQRHLENRLETTQTGIREWTPRIIEAAPDLAGDPRLPLLAAKLATLATTRPDIPYRRHRRDRSPGMSV